MFYGYRCQSNCLSSANAIEKDPKRTPYWARFPPLSWSFPDRERSAGSFPEQRLLIELKPLFPLRIHSSLLTYTHTHTFKFKSFGDTTNACCILHSICMDQISRKLTRFFFSCFEHHKGLLPKKRFHHYLYLLSKVFSLGRMKHTTFLRRELRFGLVTQRGGALRDETKRLRGRRRQTLHSSTEHLSQNTP